jgi:hypothetical protein
MPTKEGQITECGPLGWRLTKYGRELGEAALGSVLAQPGDVRGIRAWWSDPENQKGLLAEIIFGIGPNDHDRALEVDVVRSRALEEQPVAQVVLTCMADMAAANEGRLTQLVEPSYVDASAAAELLKASSSSAGVRTTHELVA